MDRARLPRRRPAVALIALGWLALALSAGVERLAPVAVFTFEQHPDLPLRAFAEGKLGIVQPTYARSYLYVAYRWMNGAPMSSEEIDGVDEYWRKRLGLESAAPPVEDESYDEVRGSLDIPWQAPEHPNARAAAQFLAVDYVYYSKCSDDAFATAAQTLEARITAFGAKSPEVAEWVRGQDYVFENCFGAGSGFIPPDVRPGVDALIGADRDYQQAAALFYSSRYGEAAAAFRRIAADADSPWAAWGEYQAGRCTLWEARTSPPDSGAYQAKLRQAAAELRRTAGGEAPPVVRAAARWLLARILIRIEPAEAAKLLTGRLLSPLGADARAEELRLFTQLLDNLAADPAALAEARAADDLVDWIFTFQGEEAAEAEHAMQRWRADGSVAWMLAALSKVTADDPATPELLESAVHVQGSPGSPTLEYHRARLMAESGARALGRTIADGLVQQLQGFPSARNLALGMRAALADGAEDLLFYGARPPALVTYAFGFEGRPLHAWERAEEQKLALDKQRTAIQWGPETAELLNESVTVDALAAMLDVEGQPERMRTELLLAAWTRSVLLDRWDLARRLTPRVGEAAPKLKADMDALMAVTEPSRMRYFAASALLKTPGASILLRSGPLRLVPPDEVDPHGLNWWPASWPSSGLADYLPEYESLVVKDEWRRIAEAGDGYAWIVEQALAEAERPDAHPSVPETLHRAVISVRAPEIHGRIVETLERRFPDSQWTKSAAEAARIPGDR